VHSVKFYLLNIFKPVYYIVDLFYKIVRLQKQKCNRTKLVKWLLPPFLLKECNAM